jgi:transposase InsO family protein
MTHQHLTSKKKQRDEEKNFQKIVKKLLTWEFALPKFKGSHVEAKRDISQYFEVFYNRFRLYSAIGYDTPENNEHQRNVA